MFFFFALRPTIESSERIFFLYPVVLCLLLRHIQWTRIPKTHGT